MNGLNLDSVALKIYTQSLEDHTNTPACIATFERSFSYGYSSFERIGPRREVSKLLSLWRSELQVGGGSKNRHRDAVAKTDHQRNRIMLGKAKTLEKARSLNVAKARE